MKSPSIKCVMEVTARSAKVVAFVVALSLVCLGVSSYVFYLEVGVQRVLGFESLSISVESNSVGLWYGTVADLGIVMFWNRPQIICLPMYYLDDWSGGGVMIPLWPVTVVAMWWLIRNTRSILRSRDYAVCRYCGYDQRGSRGHVCSECGHRRST